MRTCDRRAFVALCLVIAIGCDRPARPSSVTPPQPVAPQVQQAPREPEVDLVPAQPFSTPETTPVNTDVPITRKVRLSVQASTWREAAPFDVTADLHAKLRAGGVEVVEEAATDGEVRIDYEESEGNDYDIPTGDTEKGTKIFLAVEIRSDKTLPKPMSLEIEGESPTFVNVTLGDVSRSLYQAALDSLQSNELYECLGDYVAAALGEPSARSRLMPVLVRREAGSAVLNLLETLGHQPSTPAEHVYVAAAKGNLGECARFGRDVVIPLTRILAAEADQVGDWSLTEEVAGVLRRIGDGEAAPALKDRLASFGPARAVEEEWIPDDEAEVVAALILALETSGDESALLDVSRFEGDARPEVVEAVATAQKALWERVSIRPRAEEHPPEIVLRVVARGWLDRRFDVEGSLRRKLEEVGVRVLAAESKEADAVVLVEYEERKGGQYRSFYGTGAEAGFGTLISCRLSVINAKDRLVAGPFGVDAQTPSQMDENGDLHVGAIREFEKSDRYGLARDFVAAAVGRREAVPKLIAQLRRPDAPTEILQLVRRLKGEWSEEDQALIAVAGADFAACARLGKVVTGPLLEVFKDSRDWDTPEGLRAAAAIFAGAGERRAAPLLVEKLKRLCPVAEEEFEETPEAETATVLIEALGRLKEPSVTEVLQDYARDKRSAIAEAAKRALEEER
ncbi:MAG: hypothetical protein HYY16_15970 [Planctomycetes bacterium]|nr:hypothetical protein [Planctomycetota bacterium]